LYVWWRQPVVINTRTARNALCGAYRPRIFAQQKSVRGGPHHCVGEAYAMVRDYFYGLMLGAARAQGGLAGKLLRNFSLPLRGTRDCSGKPTGKRIGAFRGLGAESPVFLFRARRRAK
jgi:hypothetical protein